MFTGHRQIRARPEESGHDPGIPKRPLEDFLGGSRHASALEDGARIFDLADSKYSVSGECNKCLLHFCSTERNAVRRVLDAEVRNGNLRPLVQRLGQARPSKLEICKGQDHRTPVARRAARAVYHPHLRRALERHLLGFTIAKLSNPMDLERSFGPIYARGIVRQGRSAFAVLGVHQRETQTSIDAALTFGILWLDACRHSALSRERRVHLDPGAAKWHLYEFDERHDALTQLDFADRGNIDSRLVRCPAEASTLDRFADSIHQVLGRLPECEVAVLSSAEVAFRWHGLEFARVSHEPGSFRSGQEIAFGVGAEERVLDDRNAAAFDDLLRRPRSARGPKGSRHHALWRRHPERWLESLVVRDVSTNRGALRSQLLVLAGPGLLQLRPRHARRAHNHPRQSPSRLGTQSRRRYPPAAARPRLLVKRCNGIMPAANSSSSDISPAANSLPTIPCCFWLPPPSTSPATDTVLHYLAAEIDWTLVGIDERWRDGVRAIFRKRPRLQNPPRRHRETEEALSQSLYASE